MNVNLNDDIYLNQGGPAAIHHEEKRVGVKPPFTWTAIAEFLFWPLVYNLPKCRKADKMVLTKNENVIFLAEVISDQLRVQYEPNQIEIENTLNKSIIAEQQVTQYFWRLMNGDLPDFDEQVFHTCYYILSLYTGFHYDPYWFYGEHKIEGQSWTQGHSWTECYDDVNAITINGFSVFAGQRPYLYDGILWAQKYHRHIVFKELNLNNDVVSVIESYL